MTVNRIESILIYSTMKIPHQMRDFHGAISKHLSGAFEQAFNLIFTAD
jgi:hypothetical protein